MKPLFTFCIAAIMIFAISCSEEEDNTDLSACGVDKPLSQLSWLNDIVSGNPYTLYAGARVYSYNYKSSTVFYIDNPASSLAAATRNVYNCDGKVLISFSSEADAWALFEKERKDGRLLWKKE